MEHNIFLLVVSIVCMVSFLGYSAFMFGIYMRFIIRREKDFAYNHEPLSIIIAARNEAENLRKFLPSVINQDRDVMEIIVVNDGSTDETAKVLYEFAERSPVLRIIHIEKSVGKKLALTKAIQSAKYDLLIFTDADCKPASVRWASEMASRFTDGIEIVLGYGGYEKRKGWLNRLIQLDTATIAARYAGFVIWGNPYMGVGRNLAYRKSLWEKIGGFSSHADLPYGDDDLFIMEAATKKNTAICFDPSAFTYSVPEKNWGDWLDQKTRHIQAGKRYRKNTTLLLGSEFLFEALFWLSGLILSSLGGGIWFVFLLTFYFLYKLFVFNGIFKLLNIKHFFLFLPILSVSLLFALFLIGINAIFARQVKWKQE